MLSVTLRKELLQQEKCALFFLGGQTRRSDELLQLLVTFVCAKVFVFNLHEAEDRLPKMTNIAVHTLVLRCLKMRWQVLCKVDPLA